MKELEINEKVSATIKKLKEWESKKGEINLFLNGKYKKIPIKRRYMDRSVTLCIRSNCDASGNCCHYGVRDGIGICFYADSYYDILYKDSVIIDHLTHSEEEEFLEKMNFILKEIHDRK